MKLYFAAGACSMAPHIILREAGIPFDLEKVDLSTKRTASGEDFLEVNPKGYVPALKLDNGEVLTEVAVILQYLADQKPQSGLAYEMGTTERYRSMEWLNFVSSELHKQYAPLFNPKVTSEWRTNQIEVLGRRLDYLTAQINGKPYLMGDRFTVVDAYLFTVLNWSSMLKVDLEHWPKLKDYVARIADRPAVKETMKVEGLQH
jgi:glutathione S-transferase